jgi:3D (Asp-Asp-Asp) domain-containing protein
MKKFLRKYGAIIVFYALLITIFFTGFIIGRYGKAAPSAEIAEFGVVSQAPEETGATAPETGYEAPVTEPPTTEPPEAEYKTITVNATAYCPCEKCSGKWGRNTATGVLAEAGRTIAVDPKVIPYGTEVIINGNTYIAEDCGGGIKGNDVDIFFDTHEEALQFGRKKLTAKILN